MLNVKVRKSKYLYTRYIRGIQGIFKLGSDAFNFFPSYIAFHYAVYPLPTCLRMYN